MPATRWPYLYRPGGRRGIVARPETEQPRQGVARGRSRGSISVSWPMSCIASCSSIFNAREPSTSA